MDSNKTRLISTICFLVVGLILIYLGYIKSNEPIEYSIDDTKITMIDMSSESKKVNVIGMLGIGMIIFATLLTAFSFLNKPKAKSIEITPQEKKIIEYIQNGLTNREIATELSISISTVKTHNNNIYKKLGINSREELLKKR